MSVLKYRDPETGEYKIARTVKVVEVVEGGEVVKAADVLTASGYPEYITPEVMEMVGKVNAVRGKDSIVFVAMADSHYIADQSELQNATETNASALQANQAAKVLSYLVKPDFFAHLGDVGCGHGSTTPEMLKKQIEDFISMFREAKSDLPVFICIGNHDTGIYYHEGVADGNIHTMTGDYLYKTFTAHSESEDTVMAGEENGGYCYRDFADKKLRVFMLNTSEKLVAVQSDSTTYGAQRVWLANALLDLNTKDDAVEWGFIILCHYPADYGGTMPLSDLLHAYVKGESHTISDPTSNGTGDGTSHTVDFAGKNGAKMIAQFHGHVHNFKADKLYSGGAQYDAHRLCIPNAQYNRENYYGTVGGVNFAEDVSYPKTANSANGTSFVVNVINPSEQKIYSFCYGAGYDRVIGYGAVTYYSITRSLTNVTSNNTYVSIEEGRAYSEIITPDTGANMNTITVTMGGVDISSTAISIVNGVYSITIPQVTGNVVITAKAALRPNFTNLVPLSINADGTDFYVEGDGYDDGTYINSSGAVGTLSGYVSTGFIPVMTGAKTVRIAGDGISIDGTYTRIAFYDSNFELADNPIKAGNMGKSEYVGIVTEEDATALTVTFSVAAHANAPYIRVCTKGNGADLIVTVNEEITYGGSDGDDTSATTYAIIRNLTNVASSNLVSTVAIGSAYSTTLTANSGYELGDVSVTMGGNNVTSAYYSSSTGKVSIPAVTGTVIITATANAVQASYTNQLPISTDASGNVYNGTGYKADTYLSAGNEGARTGVYTSGFIPCKMGDVIYFKNCKIQASQSNHRFSFYDSSKQPLSNCHFNTTQLASYGGFNEVYGSDGNMTQLTVSGGSSMPNTAYMRFCCGGLDGTSIVTVNEPIE